MTVNGKNLNPGGNQESMLPGKLRLSFFTKGLGAAPLLGVLGGGLQAEAGLTRLAGRFGQLLLHLRVLALHLGQLHRGRTNDFDCARIASFLFLTSKTILSRSHNSSEISTRSCTAPVPSAAQHRS